jgi:hypothetical protein
VGPRAIIAGVLGTYDRYQYASEKRQAFEALAVKISIAVNWLPEPANTITASLALATLIAVLPPRCQWAVGSCAAKTPTRHDAFR